MPESQVAQLRARIEEECQAIQHMMLFSQSASHSTIHARYRNLEKCHDQLKPLIGEQQATGIIVDIYNQYVS